MLGTPKRLPPPFFFPRHYALLSSSLPLQSLHEATMVVVVMMTVAVVTPKRIPRASLQQVHQSCRQYCIFHAALNGDVSFLRLYTLIAAS